MAESKQPMDLAGATGIEKTQESETEAVANGQAYRALVRERSRLAWILTGTMLAIYFGYVLLIAFAPEFLARPIGRGATTIGIPMGLAVIVAGILLTGIYVWRANGRFDALTRQITDGGEA